MSAEQNNTLVHRSVEARMGQFAHDLLNESSGQLPPHLIYRLEKARQKALAQYQPARKWFWQRELTLSTGSSSFSNSESNWGSKLWGIFGVTPILALVLGMFVIVHWQSEARILDIAEVDTAILTDTVPPEAYKDDGFIRFLITNGKDLVDDEKEGV